VPGETHRHHAILDPAETIITPLPLAVVQVFGDDAVLIEKRALRDLEGDAVLPLD
jgi:hypothetical protein